MVEPVENRRGYLGALYASVSVVETMIVRDESARDVRLTLYVRAAGLKVLLERLRRAIAPFGFSAPP